MDTSMIELDFKRTLMTIQLAAWSCFKGGWAAITCSAWVLYREHKHNQLYMLAGAVACAIGSCLLVIDTARASSFAFPMIPVAFALLKESDSPPCTLRILACIVAVISVLAPNFEIIAGSEVKWLPSLLALVAFPK
jgi:hypothetical protein